MIQDCIQRTIKPCGASAKMYRHTWFFQLVGQSDLSEITPGSQSQLTAKKLGVSPRGWRGLVASPVKSSPGLCISWAHFWLQAQTPGSSNGKVIFAVLLFYQDLNAELRFHLKQCHIILC